MTPSTIAGQARPAAQAHKALILIVDDDEDFRGYLMKLLNSEGFDVLEARSSDEGFDLALRHRPRLALVDWVLKGALGIDLARSLKLDVAGRAIPVVVMSGIKESADDELRARRAGAEGFLAKSEILPGPGPFLRRIEALLAERDNSDFVADAPNAGLLPAKTPLRFSILVVDDDPETADLLKVLFDAESYRILWASSGVQGLRMAASESPELVLLDLRMPGMPGEEVCRRLRQQEKSFYLPILVYSAHAELGSRVNAMELGADSFLPKPAPVEYLKSAIIALIRRHRLRQNDAGTAVLGALSFKAAERRLDIAGGSSAELTPIECAICSLLIGAEGRFVSRELFLKKLGYLWRADDHEALKVHVSHLRKKLGPYGGLLECRRGEGYRLNAAEARRLSPS